MRLVAMYAQYGYYRSDLPMGSTTLDILPRFSRETASIGLSLWVPIIRFDTVYAAVG